MSTDDQNEVPPGVPDSNALVAELERVKRHRLYAIICILFLLPTAAVLLAHALNSKPQAQRAGTDLSPPAARPSAAPVEPALQSLKVTDQAATPGPLPVNTADDQDAKVRATETKLRQTEQAVAEQEARDRAAKKRAAQEALDKITREQEAKVRAAKAVAEKQATKQTVQQTPQRKRFIVELATDGAYLKLSDGTYWTVHPSDRDTVAGLRSVVVGTRTSRDTIVFSEVGQSVSVTLDGERMLLTNSNNGASLGAIAVESAAK